MKLPIFAYGNNVLKVKAQAVASDFPNLHELIANMWETMEKANGCGLAAPQVGKSLRLFVADSQLLYEAMDERDKIAYFEKGDTGIRRVFINPQIKNISEEQWEEAEGCLSLPFLSGKVARSWSVELSYQNEQFETITETFSGMTARVILHEYDHLEGILYIDRVKPLAKKLMQSKLQKLLKGNLFPAYAMKFK